MRAARLRDRFGLPGLRASEALYFRDLEDCTTSERLWCASRDQVAKHTAGQTLPAVSLSIYTAL